MNIAQEPWFRWMDGMVDTDGSRVCDVYSGIVDASNPSAEYPSDAMHTLPNDAIPDLNDPATIGCLTALMRELLGEPSAYVMPIYAPNAHNRHMWQIKASRFLGPIMQESHRSEAAAIIAACRWAWTNRQP